MTLPTHLTGAAQAAARGEASTTFLGNVAAYDTAAALPSVYTFTMPIALAPVVDSITAKGSGNHATATALTGSINNLGTVAADNDTVVLPVMSAGEIVAIVNSGSKSAQVFAAGTGTINGVATDTGVALASGKVGIYIAVTASNIRGGSLA